MTPVSCACRLPARNAAAASLIARPRRPVSWMTLSPRAAARRMGNFIAVYRIVFRLGQAAIYRPVGRPQECGRPGGRPASKAALPGGDRKTIGSRAKFVACASPEELAVYRGGHTDITGRLYADLDQSFGMWHCAFDELQLTQVGPHDHARESGAGGIDAKYGAHQFDIRTGTPGVAIGPRGLPRTDEKFSERGEAECQHVAPIVQLSEVAVAFAHLGQRLVHVELEVER